MQQTKRWLQETKTWLKQTKSWLKQLTSWLQKKLITTNKKLIATNKKLIKTNKKLIASNVVDWQLCCGQKVLEAIRGRQIIMTLIPGNHLFMFILCYDRTYASVLACMVNSSDTALWSGLVSMSKALKLSDS